MFNVTEHRDRCGGPDLISKILILNRNLYKWPSLQVECLFSSAPYPSSFPLLCASEICTIHDGIRAHTAHTNNKPTHRAPFVNRFNSIEVLVAFLFSFSFFLAYPFDLRINHLIMRLCVLLCAAAAAVSVPFVFFF